MLSMFAISANAVKIDETLNLDLNNVKHNVFIIGQSKPILTSRMDITFLDVNKNVIPQEDIVKDYEGFELDYSKYNQFYIQYSNGDKIKVRYEELDYNYNNCSLFTLKCKTTDRMHYDVETDINHAREIFLEKEVGYLRFKAFFQNIYMTIFNVLSTIIG